MSDDPKIIRQHIGESVGVEAVADATLEGVGKTVKFSLVCTLRSPMVWVAMQESRNRPSSALNAITGQLEVALGAFGAEVTDFALDEVKGEAAE